MTNQNKAALVSVQDLEYVVQQPRQAGSVADEEGELIDRLDHLQSRLRAPVAQGERAAFDESYRTLFSVPAATPLTFPDVPDAWRSWQRRAALASAPAADNIEALEILSEYGDHNIEHGRISFDKWTLSQAGEALLRRAALDEHKEQS
ncbi:hypothetical protein [Achromobacter sp. AONIH1]|uniref:hypothetical protein n=1 Tax=Achromobacter sp. AONIH1 TaxID=1758194 RepID=UPI000CCFF4CC|nr:hypothetical protein [Achromobacter sp. AONIH1]AUT49012.1 hypothetical protein C2U31_25270 [Achromobacter sp. AONIH1]